MTLEIEIIRNVLQCIKSDLSMALQVASRHRKDHYVRHAKGSLEEVIEALNKNSEQERTP